MKWKGEILHSPSSSSPVIAVGEAHVHVVAAEECLAVEWHLDVRRVRDGLADEDGTRDGRQLAGRHLRHVTRHQAAGAADHLQHDGDGVWGGGGGGGGSDGWGGSVVRDGVVWGGSVVRDGVIRDGVVWGDSVVRDGVVWGGSVVRDGVVWGGSVVRDGVIRDGVVWGDSVVRDGVVWGGSVVWDGVVWGSVCCDGSGVVCCLSGKVLQ